LSWRHPSLTSVPNHGPGSGSINTFDKPPNVQKW